MLRFCFLLLSVSAVAVPAPTRSFAEFCRDAFEEILRESPEFAGDIGRHEYDDRWTDWSRTARDRRRAQTEKLISELQTYLQANLAGQDRITARLLDYDFRSQLEAEDTEIHLLRVGQLFGLHTAVYSTIDRMPARTERDLENIVARLRAVPAYVDQNIGLLRESIARGIMQPRLVADLVSRQVAAQMAQSVETTPLLAAFRRMPANLPAGRRQELRARAEEAYLQSFQPAWRKLQAFIAGDYTAHARPRDTIASMAGGAKRYAIMVRRLTTTNLTPDEIHRLGEEEVARIEGEMREVIKEAGFEGGPAEFQRHLAAAPERHFRSKEEMLVFCRNAAKIIEPELPRLFRHIPQLLYGVRAIPPDREAATASNAQAPAPDGSAPGWFNLNTYRPERQVNYDKEALVLHEAVPGHIFQLTLARSLQDLPALRRFYMNGAYVEGWALYAESLGSELGVYRDPYSRFGQLVSERFRAVRLVVDTGIHARGWTRQQALDYFRAYAPEASAAEVDRYISWPGQALSYKIGQLKIRQLRTTLEKRLGARFDVRDFHDRVLRNGSLPLELLEEQVLAEK